MAGLAVGRRVHAQVGRYKANVLLAVGTLLHGSKRARLATGCGTVASTISMVKYTNNNTTSVHRTCTWHNASLMSWDADTSL